MLGNIIEEAKIIPANYGSISHLPGSKMIDKEDKLLGKDSIKILTERRRDPRDLVIITEKLDGMNCGVFKKMEKLYPLMKKGYDVRCSKYSWIREFSTFVADHANQFSELLNENERICGEWLIKTHTISYNLPHEPFVAFDIIDHNHQRENYERFVIRTEAFGFTRAGLLHIGESMEPEIAMQLLKNGYHGAMEGPEGVVYRYERWDKIEGINKFECLGKFVANPLVGKEENFLGNDLRFFNKVKRKYRKYIDHCK